MGTILTPNITQGKVIFEEARLSGDPSGFSGFSGYRTHDNTYDQFSGGVFLHDPIETSATEMHEVTSRELFEQRLLREDGVALDGYATVSLTPGTLVYWNGSMTIDGYHDMAKASSSAESTLAQYVVVDTVAQGDVFVAYRYYRVTGLNTSAYSAVGSVVYGSNTAGLTATSGGTISWEVGRIEVKDATDGQIMFSLPGLNRRGFSGYSGISGYSGYTGASGQSGISGQSGTSGFSGAFSGASGQSGYSGTSGFSSAGTVPAFSAKAADEAQTRTTVADDNTMVVALEAGSTYRISNFMFWSGNSGLKLKYAYTGTVPSNNRFIGFSTIAYDEVYPASYEPVKQRLGDSKTYTLITNGASGYAVVSDSIMYTTNAGNLSVQWAGIGGESVKMFSGSCLQADKIS